MRAKPDRPMASKLRGDKARARLDERNKRELEDPTGRMSVLEWVVVLEQPSSFWSMPSAAEIGSVHDLKHRASEGMMDQSSTSKIHG